MDLECANPERTRWTLNLTPEEAEFFEYLSRTTGYTVQGLMLGRLLQLYDRPHSFLEGCDPRVLEPYRRAEGPVELGDGDHLSFMGTVLKGCRAIVDRRLSLIIETIAGKPMPTTEIVLTIPEIKALCKPEGKWEYKSVCNAVRDIMMEVVNNTKWVECRVTKSREFVFVATPALLEHMREHGSFDRTMLDSYSCLFQDKTVEDILARSPEGEDGTEEGELDDGLDEFMTDDTEDFIDRLVGIAREYARKMQDMAQEYIWPEFITVYAKTAIDTAVRLLVDNYSMSRDEFTTRLWGALGGDILYDSEDPGMEPTRRARVVYQVIHVLLSSGIVKESEGVFYIESENPVPRPIDVEQFKDAHMKFEEYGDKLNDLGFEFLEVVLV